MAIEVVLDTETTGLDPLTGDRIVEIGAVELDNLNRTGRVFHQYLNPEMQMSEEARKIHGLTDAFLMDKPRFSEIAGEFIEFIGDSRLVIHNAEFDMGFINEELKRIGENPVGLDRTLDTLQYAREELTGLTRFSLDALCNHFRIDKSERVTHGALLDAELLTEVYVRISGRSQSFLDLVDDPLPGSESPDGGMRERYRPRPKPLLLTEEEKEAHLEMVRSLGENALWHHGAGKAPADGG